MTKLNRTKQAFYVDNFVVLLEEVPSNLMRKRKKEKYQHKSLYLLRGPTGYY